MKKYFEPIVSFAKNPSPYYIGVLTEKKTTAFFSVLLINVISVTPFLLILLLNSGDIPNQKYNYNNNNTELIFIALVAPIVEEIIFRYPIIYARWSYAFFILSVVFTFNSRIQFGLYQNWIMLLFLTTVFILFRLKGVSRKMNELWIKYYAYFFYSSILIFGIVHLYNFDLSDPDKLWIIPFLCLPQTISGIFLSYTRIKYGFLWCVMLHSSYNIVMYAINAIF